MFQKEGRKIQWLWVRIKLRVFQKESKLLVRLREFPCLSKFHHCGHSGETSQWSLLPLSPSLISPHPMCWLDSGICPFCLIPTIFHEVCLQNSPGSLHLLLCRPSCFISSPFTNHFLWNSQKVLSRTQLRSYHAPALNSLVTSHYTKNWLSNLLQVPHDCTKLAPAYLSFLLGDHAPHSPTPLCTACTCYSLFCNP